MSSFLRKRLALAVISIVSAPVGAATVFEVNTFQDGVDASLGGTCATATGACSLRAAIQEANNQASTGPHTIKLPAGTYNLSLQGSDDSAAAGDLDINGSMTIEGFGADKTIIQPASSVVNTEYRIFHIGATSGSPTVTIKGVTIKGGMSSQGAGIYLQTGTLNLNDSQVDGNNANQGSGALGGGIYSNGILRLSGSTISNNTVINNSFGQGGGIYVSAQATTATYITNSTISTNTVSGPQGGGIYNASSGSFVIASSTITQNAVNSSGTGGSGIFNAGTSANVRLKNTILAQNRTNGGSSIPDCSGPLASDGYNLVGFAASGGVCSFSSVNGDQVGPVSGVALSAGLGNLALNGGTTLNHLPTAVSAPTVDKGNPAGCIAAENTSLAADQRGYLRATVGAGTLGASGTCDIGAVEYNSSYSATSGNGFAIPFAVTAYASTSLSGSLGGSNPLGTGTGLTGLTFGPSSITTSKGGSVGINGGTGYFQYTPPSGSTGTDTFTYFVDNGTTRANADVTVTILASASNQQNAPVGPAAINVTAQPGQKLRGTLPFADPDALGIKFGAAIVIQAQKAAAIVTSNDSTQNNPVYEYTPPQGATGADSFQISVDDKSGHSSTITVNVTIGSSGAVTTSAPVMLGSLIRDDASRTQQTVLSLSDFAPALRNPSNLSVTLVKFLDPLSATGGSLGTLQYASNTFTFTPPTGGVSSSENRAIFRVNGTYIDSGVTKNLADVPVTLNFAAPGASTIPVPNPFSSPASSVPRNNGGTYSPTSPLLSNISLPSGATSVVFEVSNSASGTFGSSASSSLGRVDVTAPSTGVFTYTVTSGAAVTASQDTLYYRVRYTDSLGSPVTTTSATLVLNFTGAAVAPVANATTATVQRSGTTAIAPSVTNPVFGQTYELLNSATSLWGTSASSTYGTMSVSSTGFNYQVTAATLPAGSPTDLFQYRVKYTDSGTQQPVSTAQASLTLNFAAASTGLPEAIPMSTPLHVIPGQPSVITLTYMTSTRSHTALSGTQYLISSLPSKGKIYDDSTGAEITMTTMTFTSPKVRYIANAGTSGSDSFSFKVKEPVPGAATYLDSLAAASVALDIGTSPGATPLDEGGGGSLSPLALLAMLALYGRRRLR